MFTWIRANYVFLRVFSSTAFPAQLVRGPMKTHMTSPGAPLVVSLQLVEALSSDKWPLTHHVPRTTICLGSVHAGSATDIRLLHGVGRRSRGASFHSISQFREITQLDRTRLN